MQERCLKFFSARLVNGRLPVPIIKSQSGTKAETRLHTQIVSSSDTNLDLTSKKPKLISKEAYEFNQNSLLFPQASMSKQPPQLNILNHNQNLQVQYRSQNLNSQNSPMNKKLHGQYTNQNIASTNCSYYYQPLSSIVQSQHYTKCDNNMNNISSNNLHPKNSLIENSTGII